MPKEMRPVVTGASYSRMGRLSCAASSCLPITL